MSELIVNSVKVVKGKNGTKLLATTDGERCFKINTPVVRSEKKDGEMDLEWSDTDHEISSLFGLEKIKEPQSKIRLLEFPHTQNE